MARLEELRIEHADKLALAFVYIKEAHPSDEWQMDSNEKSGVVFEQPRNNAERLIRARAFVAGMGLDGEVLMDDITNVANACYAAWPERLYAIGIDGRIAYKGGMGPFDFDTDELEAFIATL